MGSKCGLTFGTDGIQLRGVLYFEKTPECPGVAHLPYSSRNVLTVNKT